VRAESAHTAQACARVVLRADAAAGEEITARQEDGNTVAFMDRLQDFLDESGLEVAHGNLGIEIVPTAVAGRGGLLADTMAMGVPSTSAGGASAGSSGTKASRRWRGQRGSTRLGVGAARALQEINDDAEDLAFWVSQSAAKGVRSVGSLLEAQQQQHCLQEQLRCTRSQGKSDSTAL
jgi:hypothetical protein